MQKVKFLLLICAIVTVVTISGCVLPGTQSSGGGGPGVIIEKFDTSLDSVESNEQVGVRLEVRNEGGYNGIGDIGTPVVAELMSIDPTEWLVTPSTVVDMGSLLMPDPDSQTPGGLGTVNWNILSPLLQRGTTKTYNLMARVYYPYETNVIKPVWFVTSEELRRIVQNGDALASDPQTQSAGPVSVTVTAGNFVKAQDYKDSKFQLQITINNVGGGQIRGKDYPVALTVEWPTWVIPVGGFCPQQAQWISPIYNDVPLALPQPMGSTYVSVWDGRSTDITCEFMILQPPSSRTSGNFDVKVGYIYSVDATTQLTVKGMEEF